MIFLRKREIQCLRSINDGNAEAEKGKEEICSFCSAEENILFQREEF